MDRAPPILVDGRALDLMFGSHSLDQRLGLGSHLVPRSEYCTHALSRNPSVNIGVEV